MACKSPKFVTFVHPWQQWSAGSLAKEMVVVEMRTAFDIIISNPPSSSMVVLTAFLQSSKRPASCMVIKAKISPSNLWYQISGQLNIAYTLNGSRLHAELRLKLRGKLFSSILARDIIDGNIATLGRELLGNDCS